GGVSRIATDLHLGPVPPQPPSQPAAITPSNPRQTIEGYFGLTPNYTEYGQNFTIHVQWDEALRSDTTIKPITTTYKFNSAEKAKSNLNAGGTLNLIVDTSGHIDWNASSLNPGTGDGLVHF